MSRLAILVLFLLTISSSVLAQTPAAPQPITYVKGEVLDVMPVQESTQKAFFTGQGDVVTLLLTSGPEKGKIVDTFNFISGRSLYEFKVNRGDKVIIAVSNDLGRTTYNVSDFERFDYVWWLLGLFFLTLIVCGRMVGLKSVAVISFSVFLIFYFFLNNVLAAKMSLTLLTLLVSAIIAGVTQVVISGWNKKSFAAILGTIGGVSIAGILSIASIYLMHLTGLDSEEAMMLKATVLKTVDFRGLLFSGMVLGALGAVMDVTISISSALHEVKQIQPQSTLKELFATGMNVGKDIMGTMSNTLILAYIGSSLPLLLLISAQPQTSLLAILNQNMIVTEIARALTGSIGLICAIPLTAFISAWLMRSK
jgi:uncharacterized membrane protein